MGKSKNLRHSDLAGRRKREKKRPQYHKVQDWLQLLHHFRPWAHVIAVRVLLIHISSYRPEGTIYHTQDNQMQHISARLRTPLQNASLSLACFFLQELKERYRNWLHLLYTQWEIPLLQGNLWLGICAHLALQGILFCKHSLPCHFILNLSECS